MATWYKTLATAALGACAMLACGTEPPLEPGAVRILSVFPDYESEPNNTIASCDTMSWARNFDLIPGAGVPAPYSYGGNGRLSSASDVDHWCAFQAFTSGDTLVAFTVTDVGGSTEPLLALYGPTGELLVPNEVRLSWRIASTARHYLRVSAASAPAGSGRYSVFMHVGRTGTLP